MALFALAPTGAATSSSAQPDPPEVEDAAAVVEEATSDVARVEAADESRADGEGAREGGLGSTSASKAFEVEVT